MVEFKGTKGEWEYGIVYGKKRPRISVVIHKKTIIIKS